MSNQRLTYTARRLMTGLVLAAVIATTFLPAWASPTQAASVPETGTVEPAVETNPAEAVPANTLSAPGAPAPERLGVGSERVAMNALVLSEPGRVDELAQTITAAGGYVYLRQGDALFVGLDKLGYNDLAPLGARAVYEGAVAENDLAALSAADREVVQVWNAVSRANPSKIEATTGGEGLDSSIVIIPSGGAGGDPASVANAPSNEQTSVFMVGSVAVEVVFVESQGPTENWTADEISKVKTEVANAFNWWTVAATAPDSQGDARPSAHLTWTLTYRSPLEGTTAEREKVKISLEPIQGSVAQAANGWIPTLAGQFGFGATQAGVRAWAHNARTTAKTDWGFVLFVVDSSSDPDGRFDVDGKVAGAALAGPWAVVTYDGGDLGINNLEVMIAKMTGHVFGAGDESYDEVAGKGCKTDEYYGYLRVEHTNCERSNPTSVTSLMRAGNIMVTAYQAYALSEPARRQVGWRDNDADGVYDVIDTLTDPVTSSMFSPPPVCPTLHLANIPVANTPTLPDDFGSGNASQWPTYVWDESTHTYSEALKYTPTNINRVGYVWGRINGGAWIAAAPSDGTWDEENETYNLQLPGNAGTTNKVDIAVMNRWEQQAFRNPTPVDAPIAAAPNTPGVFYDSNDPGKVALFQVDGTPGGWYNVDGAGYLGGSIKQALTTGSEACFSFEGTEVTLFHSQWLAGGKANVYVDGKLHSIIDYTGGGDPPADQVEHIISNLAQSTHTVSLVASSGVITFDAYKITGTLLANVIAPADTTNGYYESSVVLTKLQFVGQWAEVTPFNNATRKDGPGDNKAMRSTYAYDRIYAAFTGADTIAVYRGVFPGGGTADVYLNNTYWGTMNNAATKEINVPYYISGLVYTATYTLEIRINSGTGPNGTRFDFDALRLMRLDTDPSLKSVPADGDPLKVSYKDAQEKIGGWLDTPYYAQANEEGSVSNLYFKGSAVAVRRFTGGMGVMELYVDGKLIRTVDNFTGSGSETPIVLHGFDSGYPHVLQVRLARGSYILWNYLYGFTVYNVSIVQAGKYEESEYDAQGKPTTSKFFYDGQWYFPPAWPYTPGPSASRYVTSMYPDSYAYLYFTGVDSATVYGGTGGYGTIDIYVNGQLKGRFNQLGAFGWQKGFTITGLDKQTRNVLELRPGVHPQYGYYLGPINFDYVVLYNRPVLTPGTYENNSEVEGVPALQFSGQWALTNDALASGGNHHASNSVADEVVFDVRNTSSIVVYRRVYAWYGKADVYVDGVYHSSFDNFGMEFGAGGYQRPYVIAGIDPGFNHRIQIKPQPLNPYYAQPITIDKIVVRGNLQEAPGVTYLQDNFYENDNQTAINGGAIVYHGSSWRTETTPTNPRGAGQTHTWSAFPYDRAMVVFYGNAFAVYFNRNLYGGMAQIYVDGKDYGYVYTAGYPDNFAVPFSITGLERRMHTIDVQVLAGRVQIDGYRAMNMLPDNAPTYEVGTLPIPTPEQLPQYILSGVWKLEDGYLTTTEAGATLSIYAKGGDTLYFQRRALPSGGYIEVYVNNQLNTTADGWYPYLIPGQPDENFVVSGLGAMRQSGHWLQLRNLYGYKIALKRVRVTELSPKLTGSCSVEAEGDQVARSGYWYKYPPTTPSSQYSGGYLMYSFFPAARLYVAVQNVSSVTVYRPLVGWGNIAVYIDGQYWGVMDNLALVYNPSAPFIIGPIPEPSQSHVIELRQASPWVAIAIDKITCQAATVLTAGYYENDSPQLANAYTGSWSVVAMPEASGGNIHRSYLPGDRVSTMFDGNMVKIYRQMWLGAWRMTAYIDGQAYPINNYAWPGGHRVPHTILLPKSGLHTLELVGNNGALDFDALEIGNAIPATFGYYQENHPKVYVNDVNLWQTVQSNQYSGGAYLTTMTPYASIFFMFEGQRVTAYMTKAQLGGKFSAYLDGKFVQEVDLFRSEWWLIPEWWLKYPIEEPYYTYDLPFLPKGVHVLELRFEYRWTPGGYPKVYFDVFSVDGSPVPKPGEHVVPSVPDIGGGTDPGQTYDGPKVGCFEEAHPEWTKVGEWNAFLASGASGDQYLINSVSENAWVEFDFMAAGFSLLYHKNPNAGKANIFLDNMETPLTVLDMYNPVEGWVEQAIYSNPDPLNPNEIHTLRIVPTGTKNPASGGYNVYIDRIDLPAFDDDYTDNCYYIP